MNQEQEQAAARVRRTIEELEELERKYVERRNALLARMSEELREALDGARAREAGAYDGDRSGLASGLPGVGVADRFERDEGAGR
jgi:hypothetical protein